MEHCPEAWVINYTNPMTLCTSAFYAAEPQIKAFGCCHEVFGTQRRLANLVEQFLDSPRPDRREIHTEIAGVNHFTFATAARWNGIDLLPLVERYMEQDGFWDDLTEWALEQQAQGSWFHSKGRVAYDYYRRFGVLGAAGDRHLAEFVPWYLVSEANLNRYGVILTPSSYRMGTWSPPPGTPRRQPPPDDGRLHHTDEEGVDQMLALLGVHPLDTNVNLPNRGQLPDLPLGAIVETNAQFRKGSLSPVVPKPLPAGVRNLVRRVIDVQQMTLQAAIERDVDLAFQALLLDPLCSISVDSAWAMFNELLRANREMLPGWKIEGGTSRSRYTETAQRVTERKRERKSRT
jgi:alpha-galactosidase